EVLTSRATQRARIIANQISPVVISIFGLNQKEEDSDKSQPWLHFCVEKSLSDNDELSEFYDTYCDKEKQTKKPHELSKQELQKALKYTLDALDSGLITPQQILKLNLSNVDRINNRFLCGQVIPRLNQVNEIDLSHVEEVDDNTLLTIGKNLDYLKKLTLARTTRTTDNGIKIMLSILKNPDALSHFDASHTNITSATLRKLMDRTSDDSDLSILKVRGIMLPKEFAESLLEHFPKLFKVQCNQNSCFVQFRHNVIIKLQLDNVTEVDLSNNKKADPSILKNILSVHASPDLTRLKLDGSNCETNGDDLLKVLRRFSYKMPFLKIELSKECDPLLKEKIEDL
ncbi:SKP2B, partial [Acrasis kona]